MVGSTIALVHIVHEAIYRFTGRGWPGLDDRSSRFQKRLREVYHLTLPGSIETSFWPFGPSFWDRSSSDLTHEAILRRAAPSLRPL